MQSTLLGRAKVPYAKTDLENKILNLLFGEPVNYFRAKKYNKQPQYYLPKVVEQLRAKFALRERTPALKDEIRRSILLLLKDHSIDASWGHEVVSGTVYMLLRPAESEVTMVRFMQSTTFTGRLRMLTGEAFGASSKKPTVHK